MNAASAAFFKQGDLLRTEYTDMKIEKHIRSTKDAKIFEEKSEIALHAIKTGHTVAFQNAQPQIIS